MSITVPSNARGPILDLTLPASEVPVDIVLRNVTTGKSLTLNLPERWDGTDLSLDWRLRTITDPSGADRSALLDPEDNELWAVDAFSGTLTAEIETVANAASELNRSFVAASLAHAVAVDSTYIYWADSSGYIGRARLDGSSPNARFIGSVGEVFGIAVNATHIYWAGTGGTNIGRANIDGSSPNSTFLTTPTEAKGVALDSTYVYWADATFAGGIGRARLDGSSPNGAFINLAGEAPVGIAVNSGYVFWSRSSFIGRANIDGSSPNGRFIATERTPLIALALDAKYIYWADGATGAGRVQLDGSKETPIFVNARALAYAVAVNATYIYWANLTGAVGRARLNSAFAARAALRWEKGYY